VLRVPERSPGRSHGRAPSPGHPPPPPPTAAASPAAPRAVLDRGRGVRSLAVHMAVGKLGWLTSTPPPPPSPMDSGAGDLRAGSSAGTSMGGCGTKAGPAFDPGGVVPDNVLVVELGAEDGLPPPPLHLLRGDGV